MRITRRGWLGATAAMAGATAAQTVQAASAATPKVGAATAPPAEALPVGKVQIHAPGAGHNYDDALAALADYARTELTAWGLPGMTLSVTDAEGFVATLTLGWADRERRIPVGPHHLFQIGSISKSFIALTVLALSDQGKIDLDAPVARYLPEAPLPPEPITVAQLLSHSSGLADVPPLFPRTPDGRLWCGFAPGSHFAYSNTGYELLGRLIERVTGEPHQSGVRRFVRDKLGLEGMAGVISTGARRQFAVGYWPADDGAAAAFPGAPMEVASWNEEDTPAGSLGADGELMATYLRALIRLGRGQGAPVLSDAAARRFVAPVIETGEFGPGARYACGVAVVPIDGAVCLHHTGGMMAFSSSFHADPATGVACFASVNARNEGYRPRQTTAYAVRLMRAARAGKPLPTPPDPLAPYRFKGPSPLLGTFVSAAGEAVTLVAKGDGVRLIARGGEYRVLPQGPTRLVTDHPALSRFGLDAVIQDGKAIGFWWGETLFSRDAPRPQPVPAERLRAFAGDYLNRDPWVGGATVLVRGDTLVIDGLGPIVERGGWWSAEADVGGVERWRFDAVLNGKTHRLSRSGQDMWRITV